MENYKHKKNVIFASIDVKYLENILQMLSN